MGFEGAIPAQPSGLTVDSLDNQIVPLLVSTKLLPDIQDQRIHGHLGLERLNSELATPVFLTAFYTTSQNGEKKTDAVHNTQQLWLFPASSRLKYS